MGILLSYYLEDSIGAEGSEGRVSKTDCTNTPAFLLASYNLLETIQGTIQSMPWTDTSPMFVITSEEESTMSERWPPHSIY